MAGWIRGQRSTEAFTGGRGVKIERLHTRVILGVDSVLGRPSIRYHEMAFEAKAFRVVKVRNHTTRWYSDIRCPEWEQSVGPVEAARLTGSRLNGSVAGDNQMRGGRRRAARRDARGRSAASDAAP